jgi:site-specific DNA recombinase
MITAIYARKSTDDSAKSDDARSTTRQVDRAREYAAKRGWAVDDRFVFVDEAVSGAEWKNRHDFNRLLAALDPKPEFQVLIVSELSRIGRDTVRTPYFVQQIEEAGVAIYSYLNDAPITLADESGEMRTMLDSLIGSSERRNASRRTRDALRRRAEQGYVTGGKCFGYRNERDGSYVKRVIDPDEAAVIRRVFELYAAGVGMVTIAHRLNDEGVRPPRGKGWAPSGIREMLYRGSYRGEPTWGKLKKITRGGTRRQQHRPIGEWLTVSVPEVRIVSDDLWQRVKAQLDERAAAFPRSRDGKKLLGRPRYQDESAYLLTGFTRCSVCSGPVGTETRRHGGGAWTTRTVVAHYACLDRKRRGKAVCSNGVVLPQMALDRAILEAITGALDPAVLTRSFEKAFARLAKRHAAQAERRAQVERELGQTVQRLERLVDALADGTLPQEEIKARLATETAKKKTLAGQLDQLDRLAQLATFDEADLARRLQEKVADIVDVLGRQTTLARQMLRKLLGGEKIELEPVGSGRARGYKFRGALCIDRLIGGDAFLTHPAVVAPTGFEPVFESRPRFR